jgi:acetyl esterase/lipase
MHKILVAGLTALVFLCSCTNDVELIENNNPENYTLAEDILWASPDGFDLTMDIYTPTSGKPMYPVIVMYHGGGWLINDKSIMDQAATYLASNTEYVICNVNYRLLSDSDHSVTLNEIVNDAFGALLWVKENIVAYKGDKSRIAVTGDSAGGHLSAMIVNQGTQLSSKPFSPQSLEFTPSYLSAGRTAEEVALQNGLEVQAAVLNYGAFDVYQFALEGFEGSINPFWLMTGSLGRGLFGDQFTSESHPGLYKALSPIYNIPLASEKILPPQLLTVGSEDPVVTPDSVRTYKKALETAGQTAQYWEYQGKSHAFLDSGSNPLLGMSFEQDAPVALDVMIAFLDEVFSPEMASTN